MIATNFHLKFGDLELTTPQIIFLSFFVFRVFIDFLSLKYRSVRLYAVVYNAIRTKIDLFMLLEGQKYKFLFRLV